MPLVVINAFPVSGRPVGVGRYTINLVRSLASLSDEFRYLVLAHGENRHFFEGLGDKVVVQEGGMAARARALRPFLEHAWVPLVALRKRADIVHGVATMNPLVLPCASIFTLHDMTYFSLPHLHMRAKAVYFRMLLPRAARRADMIVTDSVSSRDDIVRCLDVPAERVAVIYPGLDEAFTRVLPEERRIESLRRLGVRAPFVLFVGMLEPRKNVPRLIRAFNRVRSSHPDLMLVLSGKKGWGLRDILETVRTERLEDAVLLLGYTEQEELAALYRSAVCLVYPSLYEGFGFPVLEAMASGCCVITSGVSSMPEIAGSAARYVDPEREEDIAGALEEVVRDESARMIMSRAGLARAALFTWGRAAGQTAEAYRAALARRGAGGRKSAARHGSSP